MVTKTPEQMALEYAHTAQIFWDGEPIEHHIVVCKEMAFLAGYQAAKPQWISVEERLPEKHTSANSILAWGISRKREYLWAEKQKLPYPFGSDRFIACYTDNTGFLDDGFAPCNVTHWMPLPAPPKGEG